MNFGSLDIQNLYQFDDINDKLYKTYVKLIDNIKYISLSDEEKIILPGLNIISERNISITINICINSTSKYLSILSKNYAWYIGAIKNDNKNIFHTHIRFANKEISGTIILYPDIWYSLVLTYDGKKILLYVDGNIDISAPYVGKNLINSHDVILGGNEKSILMINQLSFWRRYLKHSEISELFSNATIKYKSDERYTEYPVLTSIQINTKPCEVISFNIYMREFKAIDYVFKYKNIIFGPTDTVHEWQYIVGDTKYKFSITSLYKWISIMISNVGIYVDDKLHITFTHKISSNLNSDILTIGECNAKISEFIGPTNAWVTPKFMNGYFGKLDKEYFVPTGHDRILIVSIHKQNSSDINNITYGGYNMIHIKSSEILSVWYLPEKIIKNVQNDYLIRVEPNCKSDISDLQLGCITLSGIDQEYLLINSNSIVQTSRFRATISGIERNNMYLSLAMVATKSYDVVHDNMSKPYTIYSAVTSLGSYALCNLSHNELYNAEENTNVDLFVGISKCRQPWDIVLCNFSKALVPKNFISS